MTGSSQTEILKSTDENALAKALLLIRSHQLVAFPTDTVYGLGASLESPEAIEKLYAVKGRDSAKAIAVLLGYSDDLEKVALQVGPMAKRFATQFWPGPLTLVVPRRPDLPENLSQYPTIGVRMPNHPVALALLRQTGPLAVTSANLSGAANTSTAEEVYTQLKGSISLILDGGRTPGGQPSTVVDCTGEAPQILRQGPVTLEELFTTLE
jgi:L-threonylcarbamoyladenylate synthase